MSQHLRSLYQLVTYWNTASYNYKNSSGFLLQIEIIMAVLRAIIVGGASVVVGLTWWTHSRWGPKARASLKEYHRCSYNDPPAGWTGPLFKPRLDYPHTTAARGKREETPKSWAKIDFKKEPEKYMRAVLEYCMEGNLENNFVPQNNLKRDWYHAPWMSQTPIGREPIHGLTFERPAPVGYLAETQSRVRQSWAVAMYNEEGGYAFGEMWNKWGQPIHKNTKFPHHTVSFKLLFTEATPEDIPFLKGSPTWKATIAKKPVALPDGPSRERTPPIDLHFFQVDIAIRDPRADATTGWVFGTFMYHESVDETNPWRRLMPVCLTWGNDPDLTKEKYEQGERPKESWINPDAAKTLPKTRPYFGWLGRGNGPIDNFKSSCVSCHSTASHPSQPAMYKPAMMDRNEMDWFRNVKAGEKFRQGSRKSISLDYSLQLHAGFDNYHRWCEKWRPIPRWLPLYQDKAGLPSASPKSMLNARGIDFTDYATEHRGTTSIEDDKK